MPTLTFLNSRKGKLIASAITALVALTVAGVLWETAPDRGGYSDKTFGRFDNLTKLGSEAIDALEARSPGPRIGGIALKGKGKRARALPRQRVAKPKPAPTEKALGKIFYPSEFALNSVPAGLPALPNMDFSPPPIGGGPGGPFVPGTPGGGGIILIPPGGGGGGGSPPPTGGGGGGNPPPPPPPSAVPEPATWLLMIVGFGVIGGAMRRKKAALLAV